MRRRRHTGFSLLEVLLAVAILLGSLAVLSQLVTVGRKHLDKAEHIAIAQRLCENQLARLLAGIDPIEDTQPTPLKEDLSWEYRVEVRPLDRLGLAELQVGVRPAVAAPPPEVAQSSTAEGRWFMLARWIEEPTGVRSTPSAGQEPLPRSSHASSQVLRR